MNLQGHLGVSAASILTIYFFKPVSCESLDFMKEQN